MASYTLDIGLDNGTWKMLNPKGGPAQTPQVKAGDTITWQCNDADVDFQFPDDDLFVNQSGYTPQFPSGGQLSVTVAASATGAEQRTVVYAAYCTPSDPRNPVGYAEGSSPPKMIVDPG